MEAPPDEGGVLRLRFVADHRGTTRLAERHQRFPLHMTAPMFLDPALPGMAFVYLQNPSGALFGGDRLDISATLETGARVHLTTTSATKVHRTQSGPARQNVDLRLGPATLLEYLPDQIIPQGGSAYEQSTTVSATRDCVAIMSELVAPGRLARGESFEFRSLFLQTRFELDGREVCTDVTDLEPATRPPAARGVFGDHLYVATFYVVCPDAGVRDLADRLNRIVTGEPEGFGAAAVLPDGIGAFVRFLAKDSPTARSLLHRLREATRDELLGLPTPAVRK